MAGLYKLERRGEMWRVMTRRNERNWFFENTRREQGNWCRGGYIKWTESGVAGVLSVETRDGAVCDAGYGTRPGLDIAALPHGLARFVK